MNCDKNDDDDEIMTFIIRLANFSRDVTPLDEFVNVR